jgi:hypothetical protein
MTIEIKHNVNPVNIRGLEIAFLVVGFSAEFFVVFFSIIINSKNTKSLLKFSI